MSGDGIHDRSMRAGVFLTLPKLPKA
jgi:hypothetical protein